MPPVAFPNINPDDLAVTPYRHSRLVFNLPEYRRLHLSWGRNFRGPRLSSSSGTQAGDNKYVTLLPSDSWCISSWEMMMQFERQECSGNVLNAPGSALLNLAGGFELFASQSQIPGVSWDPSVVTLGSYWCRKRRAASADWHAELTADVAAYPMPALPTQNAPMRRVAWWGGTTFLNQPVYLRFYGPGAPLATQDALTTFYFGGDVGTTSYTPGTTFTPSGGKFALTLFGNGRAIMWEHIGQPSVAGGWKSIDEFEWEERGKIANRQHVIVLVPEGYDTLNLVGTGYHRLIRPPQNVSGYQNKSAVTGEGTFRLDMREDLRCPFQFGYCTFPPGGISIGGGEMFGFPFRIPSRLASGATIIPELDQPPVVGPPWGGGGPPHVTMRIYDAKTKAVLSGPGADGSFTIADATQRDYYGVWDFWPDSSHQYTPFLRGCNFRVEGDLALLTPPVYSTVNIIEASISGPDVDVDSDTCNLLVEDPTAALADGTPDAGGTGQGGLDTHADFHAQLQCTWDKADPSKHKVLFDGWVVQATGLQNRSASANYPSKRWKTYRIMMAGPWYLLNQTWQWSSQGRDFSKDMSAVIDPVTGDHPPWQIIDILKEVLKNAGFGAEQIALKNPDGGTGPNGPRLFQNGKNGADYWMNLNTKLPDFCQHLAHDYLGAKLIWDKEALPRGRWILVYPPPLNGVYIALQTFMCDAPATDPTGSDFMPVHLPQAYPANMTFVTNISSWVTPPEGNLFVVIGSATPDVAQRMAHESQSRVPDRSLRSQLVSAVGVNWRSTFFEGYPAPDPNHIDWVPYGVKPVRHVDWTLTGRTADDARRNCATVCRRMMTFGAYGLRHFQWVAPLVWTFDPDSIYGGGPRDLRTYDVVNLTKDGTIRHILLESVSPQISAFDGGDMAMMAEYKGFEIPDPLSY